MTDIKERMLLELVMAKPWKRLLAWLIDQAILGTLVLLPVYFFLKEPYPYVEIVEGLMLLSFTYFTLVEGALGRSIGKLVLGIAVYDEKGRQIGFSKAMLRRIGLITPMLGIFDAAAIMATSRRQRLFDVIANTVVIEGAHTSEAVAYLRGADIDKFLVKFGVVPQAPTKESAELAQVLKRMKEMQAKLKELRARGELTREEYMRLKEKYEIRIRELEERFVEG